MSIMLGNISNLSFIPQQNFIITTYDEIVTLSAFMTIIGFIAGYITAWVALKYGRMAKKV